MDFEPEVGDFVIPKKRRYIEIRPNSKKGGEEQTATILTDADEHLDVEIKSCALFGDTDDEEEEKKLETSAAEALRQDWSAEKTRELVFFEKEDVQKLLHVQCGQPLHDSTFFFYISLVEDELADIFFRIKHDKTPAWRRLFQRKIKGWGDVVSQTPMQEWSPFVISQLQYPVKVVKCASSLYENDEVPRLNVDELKLLLTCLSTAQKKLGVRIRKAQKAIGEKDAEDLLRGEFPWLLNSLDVLKWAVSGEVLGHVTNYIAEVNREIARLEEEEKKRQVIVVKEEE